MTTCDRNARASGSPLTSSGDDSSSATGGHLPQIALFGGQDAPDINTLKRRWNKGACVDWPAHRLLVSQWPNAAHGRAAASACFDQPAAEPAGAVCSRRSQRRGWLDVRAARWTSSWIARLERRMRCDQHGEPQGWLNHRIYGYTRFSVDALYDRGGLGTKLIGQVASLLTAQPIDLIVAHSFGGTIALRAAWRLWERGDRAARFALITLGTASGPMVVDSPMFADVPREHRRIALPPNLRSWQHFYSEADALVAAPALPVGFSGVQQIIVGTGPFLKRGHAHGLSRYLRTPQVASAVCRALDTLPKSAEPLQGAPSQLMQTDDQARP